MMLNSRFELSKIEKNTRVEREICLATLENREWKENLFLPLSKIESRKRIVSCHSRKSRVEREMGTIKFSRSREKFLFLLSIFLSRARLLSMPGGRVGPQISRLPSNRPLPPLIRRWQRLNSVHQTVLRCPSDHPGHGGRSKPRLRASCKANANCPLLL